MSLNLGILSLSVGRASVHSFEHKCDALQASGFRGIELFIEDLETIAAALPGGLNNENRIGAAHQIRAICDARKLEIIDLQPLLFFGGLIDRQAHAAQLAKLRLWFDLIAILGTDLIHVPTNFQAEGITGDIEAIVADMTEIADLGLAQKPPVRLVYEAMAWGRFVDTWEQAWEVVLRVNRPNFGICLDTFQIAGRIWADPTTPSGRLDGGDLELKKSLSRMSSYIGKRPEKLFLVQTGDAERLSSPITKDHPLHVDGQDPRMTWSRNARLFADDPKGNCFLKGPVDQICHVIFNELKYTGWVSCEVYSTSLFDPDPSVPFQHARRAADGWKSVLKTLEVQRKGSEAVRSHRVSKERKDYSWLPSAWRIAPTNMVIAFFVVAICTLCPLVLSKSTFAKC